MSIQETELAEFGEGEFGEGEFAEGEFGEYEGELGEYEGEQFLGDILGSVLGSEYEYEGEGEFGEYEGESGFGEYEYEGEQFLGDILGSVLGSEYEAPLSEEQETELAAELLEIGSEQELEQFLGNVFRSVGGFLKSPVGRALGGVLKNVAKKALPMVGGALGSMVAPGIGTAVGSKLGSMASRMFEVELEAMPAEAAEFEAARRFVNLAASAARHAANARPRPGVTPQMVARAAVTAAARQHAPGLHRVMIRAIVTPAAGQRPIGPGGTRGPMPAASRPVPGRPAGRQVPGRPAGRPVPGRPMYQPTAGRPGYRPTAARPVRQAGAGQAGSSTDDGCACLPGRSSSPTGRQPASPAGLPGTRPTLQLRISGRTVHLRPAPPGCRISAPAPLRLGQ